jgi:hypothetical protein
LAFAAMLRKFALAPIPSIRLGSPPEALIRRMEGSLVTAPSM